MLRRYSTIFRTYRGLKRSQCRQTLKIVAEDVTITITGYESSTLRRAITLALSILTLGIGHIILRWRPKWAASMFGRPAPLSDCDWVLIEVSWPTSPVSRSLTDLNLERVS